MATEVRVIEYSNEHGGHAIKRCAAFGFDSFQHRLRIKAFAWIDYRCAVRHCAQVAGHHSEAVIERHRHADPIILRKPQGNSIEEPIVENVMMRQSCSLGSAC